MIKLTKEYWDNRYIENTARWDVGEISSPIKAYIDQLEDKEITILIPGAGNSYEAEYIHQKGFHNLVVVDISSEAVSNFKSRVPSFPNSHILNEDFFELKGFFDLIIEQTFFCAIDKELRMSYAKQMAALLNQGGKLVGLLFDDPLYEDHPPYGGSIEEYLTYFEPYFTIHKMDPCYNSISPRSGREVWIQLIKK